MPFHSNPEFAALRAQLVDHLVTATAQFAASHGLETPSPVGVLAIQDELSGAACSLLTLGCDHWPASASDSGDQVDFAAGAPLAPVATTSLLSDIDLPSTSDLFERLTGALFPTVLAPAPAI